MPPSQPAPLSPVSSAIPRVDSVLRLSLHPVLNGRAVADGAWWAYSRDAAAGLPGLIAAVDQRLGRTTLRVGLHRDTWQYIPCRIPAHGRRVRIGWFRHTDPHVITLIFAGGEPVVLPVADDSDRWEDEGGAVTEQEAPSLIGRWPTPV